MDAYWSREYGEIKYQIGGGCLTDQILGQWHADLAGLGDLLSPENIAAALSSIYRENFRPTLRDHFNPCRVYAYEDEAGLIVCSWPKGSQEPATPVPYSEEVWTGLEYMFAAHLIARGFVDEGLTIVRAARARHDGSRRNPWNDIECGSYYARSLSSYALLNAFIGLSFDQRADEIGFRPARAGMGPISGRPAAAGARSNSASARRSCRSKAASLRPRASACRVSPGRVTVDGRPVDRDGDVVLLGARRRLGPGERIVIGADGRGAA